MGQNMKVMRLTGPAEKPTLIEEEVPQPRAGRGELLIRVVAAGVTPTELKWYPTTHLKTGEKRTGAIPSHEFSGIIAAVGEEVADVKIGSEVYGMNDWFADGALAEYCVTQPASVATKPARLTHIEAASVPIGALTAWQGLFDHAKLQAGERVLVHGGSGGVGLFAVQLARKQGAHVIATASAHNLEFVSGLGAEQVIDYQAARFEERVRDIDVVFDTVGGETLERSWAVLKPNGRMVTIAADAEGNTDGRVKQAFFIVEPNRKELIEIGKLLDAGQLQTTVDAVVPFSQAPAAFTGAVQGRLGRGKLVVTLAAAGSAIGIG
jgi:NADPH:quinone reductase-like Zn-dependent oxidoreductase